MFWDIITIGLGGSLGAVSRFGIGKIIENTVGLGSTWSVIAANLLGCFLFGLIFEFTLKEHLVNSYYRPFLLTGFLGSLTTFSTFTHHNFTMMRANEWITAGLNIICQISIGLFLIWLGTRLVKGA